MQHNGQISNTSRRIAKNTLFLYFRMIFLLLISLYTSSVVLNALGQTDFGTYNVIMSVVALMAICSGALTNAVNRFLTFELGTQNGKNFHKVFSLSVLFQIMLIALLSIVVVPILFWYLNHSMDIASTRLIAANWVLATCILSFFVNLLSVPYNSAIIAHEKMGAFAYISVIEGVLNLLIAIAITYSSFDRLIIYSVLMLCVKVIIRLIYSIYCKHYVPNARFSFVWDKTIIKQIFQFTGWTALGNGVGVFNVQGINLLIYNFFGATLNAATGIAAKVESSITGFVNNFITAINPQITKSYASNDMHYMHDLMCKGAKLSFLIVFFFSLPVLIETPTILNLWLRGNIPPFTIIIIRLTLISAMFRSLAHTIIIGVNATGNIKKYQITVSLIGLLCFPLAYVLFKMGARAYMAYFVVAIVDFILIWVRIIITKNETKLPLRQFMVDVVWKIIKVVVLSVILPFIAYFMLPGGLLRFIIVTLLCFISTAIMSYLCATTIGERAFIKAKIQGFLRKRN